MKYAICSLLAVGVSLWAYPFVQAGYKPSEILDEAGMSFRAAATAVTQTWTKLPATFGAQYKMAQCVYDRELSFLHDKALVERGIQANSSSLRDQVDASAREAAARARIAKREVEKVVGVDPCRP